MRKFLSYLLILTFLFNMPLPVFAQNNDLSAGQNISISTALTGSDEIVVSGDSLSQNGKDQSVSGKAYKDQITPKIEEKKPAQYPSPGEIIPPEIDIIDQQPPIKNEIIEVEVNIPQNSSIEDFVYGHSVYYNILKKHNRLDLLGKSLDNGQSVSDKVYKDQNASVKDKIYKKQKESVVDKAYKEQNESVSEEVYEVTEQMLNTMVMQGSENQTWYDALVGPSVMNRVNNVKYAAWDDNEEIISPQTGDLTIKQTDIKLPGRNGLDLAISRIY